MSQASFEYHVHDEAGTERLGQSLAEHLPAGSVVALDGPLGAGKTRLVQAIAAALGVDRRDVVSPTFVLVHEYRGRRPIIHIDAYRVRDDDEFLQLGTLEYFAAPNLALVEWAERVESCLPDERLQVAIEALPGDERVFRITGRGALAGVVEQLRAALGN
ncbi:MAG: tRNA (adenosine(37)-N6)-threonylcarbamoyltransferase complex ATPase subunit type 1 TsaE [Pirellulales bacterium]